MMSEKISYSELALDAMKRAAEEATKKAAQKDLKIPVWKDGKIVYLQATDRLS